MKPNDSAHDLYLRRVSGGGPVLEPKQFKTVADCKAHKLLCEAIGRLFPEDPILSEEDSEFSSNRPDSYWLIDPIDGTASWYEGFEGFVSQIAYIENACPIYGAVYAPLLKSLWTGLHGQGAKLNGITLPMLHPSVRLNLIDNYPKPRRIAARIIKKSPATTYIECGSLGLKSCKVADGTADLFAKDVVVRDWDIAPASVIIGEVGGVICDLKGKRIPFTGSFEKHEGLVVARDQSVAQFAIDVEKS